MLSARGRSTLRVHSFCPSLCNRYCPRKLHRNEKRGIPLQQSIIPIAIIYLIQYLYTEIYHHMKRLQANLFMEAQCKVSIDFLQLDINVPSQKSKIGHSMSDLGRPMSDIVRSWTYVPSRTSDIGHMSKMGHISEIGRPRWDIYVQLYFSPFVSLI